MKSILAVTSAAILACVLLITVASCSGNSPTDPASSASTSVTNGINTAGTVIKTACTEYTATAAPLVNVASLFFPKSQAAIQSINTDVTAACAVPLPSATGENAVTAAAQTAVWVALNAGQIKAAASAENPVAVQQTLGTSG